MLGLSDDQWVNFLTVLSVLSAAGFGLLGLFTDYKKRGKVTSWGRLAAAGIGLSASLSILLNIAQGKVEARNREVARSATTKQEATYKARYDSQLASLNTLADNMRQSLDDQADQQIAEKRIINSANTTLIKTDALSRQEQGNSTRMLRSLWNNANHVSGDSIMAAVSFLCESGPVPHILSEDAIAGLVFKTPKKGGGSIETSFMLPLSRSVRPENMAAPSGYQSYLFSGGIGELGRYDQLENWRGAAASLVVRSVGRDAAITSSQVFSGGTEPGRELFMEYTGPLSTLPCVPQLFLIVGGRDLVDVEGAAYQTMAAQANIPRGTIYTVFPGLPFNSNEIPRFGATKSIK